MKSHQRLPVDALLPELRRLLGLRPAVVLRAPAGAGKTTRVPPAMLPLLDEGRRVVVLEPRRVAARAAAVRVAEENDWSLGDQVGYQVRFDRRCGPRTRLLVVTQGVFLQRLQRDPFLEGVGAVVFDEFHERTLEADLALAMTRQVQREVRPDLKIVVMSATLETGPVAAYLGDCPILESEGRLHPVEIRHLGLTPPSDLASVIPRVASTVRQALASTSGDLLVFLPGVGEIHRVAEALGPIASSNSFRVVKLYGDLPLDEQELALRKVDRRRVVLATNVAETSVTVEGVSAVVDTGLARTLRYDAAVGLDRLELGRISRASADQRTGRAGREGSGIAYRLWTAHEERGMAERPVPEVQRIDLAGPVLQLLVWGEPDPRRFDWYETPDALHLERALELLEMLGATRKGAVTPLGRELSQFPVQPRLARMLIEGDRLGQPSRVALLAALLGERDPFSGPPAVHLCRSDYAERLESLEEFSKRGDAGSEENFNRGAARFVLRVRDQLLGVLGSGSRRPSRSTMSPEEAIAESLLSAFPDRLARRRGPGDRRGVLVGGRGVVQAEESGVLDGDLFLAMELSVSTPGAHADFLVRKAVAVDVDWLPADQLETRFEAEFDVRRERVVGWRRTRFGDLVIEERETPVSSSEATEILCRAAEIDLQRALDLTRPEVESFLNRVAFLREAMPELELPSFEVADFVPLLPQIAQGKRSFEELRRAPLLKIVQASLGFRQRQALEREAPERIEAPSGSKIRLVYEKGRPPVLPVRIQEMFGATETPRLAAGRVPVLLHLLAPNHRPQQVTQDLAGFWQNTYPQVRKELRGRYPKHAWPEDPIHATAKRHVR